jgi:hypothetical protein
MLAKLFEPLTTAYSDRLKNPLIGSFVVSWLALNWKAISYFILGNEDILDKIQIIDQYFTCYLDYLIYPLLISLFYLLALPHIMNFFDKLNYNVIKDRKLKINNALIDDFDNKLKLVEKEVKIEDAKLDFRKASDLNSKISELQKQLDARDGTIDKLNNIIKEVDSNLNNSFPNIEASNITSKIYDRGSQGNFTPEKENEKEFYKFISSPYSKDFRAIVSAIDTQIDLKDQFDEDIYYYYLHNNIIHSFETKDGERQELTSKGLIYYKEYLMN